jgi:hypothetical protein
MKDFYQWERKLWADSYADMADSRSEHDYTCPDYQHMNAIMALHYATLSDFYAQEIERHATQTV